jgi:hypothetical protein
MLDAKPLTAAHAIQVILMTSLDVRAALERHWAASDASDFETEHEIYCDDAILDYPQSGERIPWQTTNPVFTGRSAEQKAVQR